MIKVEQSTRHSKANWKLLNIQDTMCFMSMICARGNPSRPVIANNDNAIIYAEAVFFCWKMTAQTGTATPMLNADRTPSVIFSF